MSPEANIANLEIKLQPFYESYQNEQENYNIIYSQPLTDIHLKSNLKWELEANGDMNNVYIFTMLAVFVLMVSCINYLNLTVAESYKRFKEVGIRKVFGAFKKSLIALFMIETILIISISLVVGSILSELLFRYLGGILGREISLLHPENLGIFFWYLSGSSGYGSYRRIIFLPCTFLRLKLRWQLKGFLITPEDLQRV